MKLAEEFKKLLHIGGTTPGRVLVLDGSDAVGHRVVERLIDAEYTDNLRVGVRTLKQGGNAGGAELVPFVWEDESTYATALKGVKTVFVTLPTVPTDFDRHFPKFIKACTTNQVKRVVKLSFFHAIKPKAEHPSKHYGFPDYVEDHDGFHEVPLIHKHALCDGDLIAHTELDVTILFATHLMSNIFFFGFERKALTANHEFYGGCDGTTGVNYVSPNDVADVAVKAIFDKTHNRQAYHLTGPGITNDEVAALLTETIGTKVNYFKKPLDAFGTNLAAIEKIKLTGLEEKFPQGDIKKVTDHEAETFADYLKEMDRMTPLEVNAITAHTAHRACFPQTGTETEAIGEDKGVWYGNWGKDTVQPTESEVEVEVTPAVTKKAVQDTIWFGFWGSEHAPVEVAQ